MSIYTYVTTHRAFPRPRRPIVIETVPLLGVARSRPLRDPHVRPASDGGGSKQHAVLDPHAAQGTRTDHDQRPGAGPRDGPDDGRTEHPAAAAETPDRREEGGERRPAERTAFDE